MNDRAAATCVLSKEGTVTTVKVDTKCTVRYEFDTSATNADLALRYLVVIDGSVVITDGGKPRSLSGQNRTIQACVNPGSKVELILNSDVHPDFRRHRVYAVQTGTNDVRVKITERCGHQQEAATLVKTGQAECDAPGRAVDLYQGWLTGDIWQTISNRYTEAEADAMLPADTDATVRDAICRIYRGLPSNELVVNFPASDTAGKLQLRVRFDEPGNVRANTSLCPLLTEVLPRVHPRAFAAMLSEAHASEVTQLRITSGWRPMLGSIVHRAGLGLDINYVESATQHVSINRVSLLNRAKRSSDNVSEQEPALYDAYERAIKEKEVSEIAHGRALASLNANRDPNEKERFQASEEAADVRKRAAKSAAESTKRAWIEERDSNEKSLIRTLRGKLGHNKSVTQVLDPWYMNLNTQSGTQATPNEFRNTTEKIHKDHLHITILDAKIL